MPLRAAAATSTLLVRPVRVYSVCTRVTMIRAADGTPEASFECVGSGRHLWLSSLSLSLSLSLSFLPARSFARSRSSFPRALSPCGNGPSLDTWTSVCVACTHAPRRRSRHTQRVPRRRSMAASRGPAANPSSCLLLPSSSTRLLDHGRGAALRLRRATHGAVEHGLPTTHRVPQSAYVTTRHNGTRTQQPRSS